MAAPDYSGIYEAAGQKFNVDPLLLQAIAQHESGQQVADPRNPGQVITSPPAADGQRAYGIMQFQLPTAIKYGVDVSDPVSSINGAAHYMSDLLARNKGDVVASLAQYGGYPTPQAAMTYANSVAGNYQRLQGQAHAQPAAAQQPQGDAVDRFMGSTPAPPTAPSQAPQQPGGPDPVDKWLNAPTPAQSAPSAPTTPTQPAAPPQGVLQRANAWLERNVGEPTAQILDPTKVPPGQAPAPLFGVPAVSSTLAGGVQGMRDVGQNINNLANYVNARFPWLSDLDKAAVARGLISDPATSQLPAQTAAAQQQYADSYAFPVARTLTPIIAGAGGLGGGAVGLPGRAAAAVLPGRVLPAIAEGAGAGATSNLLTSSGGTTPGQPGYQDPGTAAAAGAIGGGAIGGATSALVGRPVINAMADRLGFNLSLGEQGNPLAKNVEDVTAPLPFSGASQKTAEHTGNINRILRQEIGAPVNQDAIDVGVLNQAKAGAGQLMDQAQNFSINGNTDPQFLNEMAQTAHDATLSQVHRVSNLVDHIQNIMAQNNGILPGADLHNLISKNGVLQRLIDNKTDMLTGGFAGDLKSSLLDAAGRDAANQGSPAFADFQQGRQQWKAIKTIENSVVRNQAGTDEMSWQGLKNNIFNNYDMSRTGPGNDMQDLARVLNGPLKELKSSGTGRQLLMQSLLGLGETGGFGGLGAAGALAGGVNPLVAGALSAAGPIALGRASRAGLPYINLGNQLLQRSPVAPAVGRGIQNLTGGAVPP